ncbi:MAG TPA: acyltransferase [Edaphobacter sp.]
MNQSSKKPAHFAHLPELDGIRGIAALMVFFHHLCFTGINLSEWHNGLVQGLFHVFVYGDSGVDLFFVLSGFLITSLLIRDRESPRYYQDFYWKRALRILPLYVLCIAGLFLSNPEYGRFALLCLLFIANFAQAFNIPSVGPFWTLAIEEQFYLLWPTIVRRRSLDSLRHWALGIVGFAIAMRLLFACYGHFNYHFTFLHCDGLALGALLACLLERSQRIGRGLDSKRPLLLSMLVGGAALIAVALLMIPRDSAHIAFVGAIHATGLAFLCGSVVGLAIAYTGHPLLAWLRSGFLAFFGLISYAFYMFHLFVRDAYDRRYPLKADDLASYFIRLGVVLGVSIALALISRYVVELPIMGLRKYVLRPAVKPIATVESAVEKG